jgi:hypothetical protein
METPFEVTWDYLCPFARNAHEHLVEALEAGASWDVQFRYFSLAQSHLDDGTTVWDDPAAFPGVLAGLAGIVVREKLPESFLEAHTALFAARHDKGLDLRSPDVVADALGGIGLDGQAIVEEALSGWPVAQARQEHESAVKQWEVFGVPTFIAKDRAVFVRLMHRPRGDGELARATIDKVLDLFEDFPELNEYKFTQIPR